MDKLAKTPSAPLAAYHRPRTIGTKRPRGPVRAIAAALKADRLLLLTDVSGVKNSNDEVITELSAQQIRDMIKDGTISDGMIPKTETALYALDGGVRAVVILDGRVPNACLLELFTEHGAGSLIRN